MNNDQQKNGYLPTADVLSYSRQCTAFNWCSVTANTDDVPDRRHLYFSTRNVLTDWPVSSIYTAPLFRKVFWKLFSWNGYSSMNKSVDNWLYTNGMAIIIDTKMYMSASVYDKPNEFNNHLIDEHVQEST